MVIVLFISALLLRFFFLSPWLTDWDSVQFAMGLHDFNVVNHQPHPPGYILYIALGRLAYFFTQNDTLALTSLSALLGALSIFPFYLLAKQLFSKQKAMLLSAILIFAPIHWNLSINALTNIPGMTFCILSIYLVYTGRGDKNRFLVGSALAGITVGIRFAEYTILISLIIATALYTRKILLLVKALIYFLSGVFLWLIPLIVITGFSEFLQAYKSQSAYVAGHDSINNLSISETFTRLKQISYLFEIGLSRYFFILIALIFIGLIFFNKKVVSFNLYFVSIWIISYLLPLIFIYNLEVPRHILPLLPPLLLLFGLTTKNFPNIILTPLMSMFIIVFSRSGLIQTRQVHTLIPPSIAPVNYILDNYTPENMVIVSSFTYRQFQYYAPEFENYWGRFPSQLNKKYLAIDSDQLANKIPNNFQLVDKFVYSGPVEVFPRLPITKLYVFENRSSN